MRDSMHDKYTRQECAAARKQCALEARRPICSASRRPMEPRLPPTAPPPLPAADAATASSGSACKDGALPMCKARDFVRCHQLIA